MDEEQDASWTVRELRSRWKPTKERLVEADEHEDIRIRIHRACSWLQRVERLEDDGSTTVGDSSLIFRWIALNAVMGEVFRARDSDLERDVAIKVLPADLADDPNPCPGLAGRVF